MVDTKQIRLNQLIDYLGFEYRIIQIDEKYATLVRTNSTKLTFRKVKLKTIFDELNKGNIEFIEEEKKVLDISTLNSKALEEFNRKQKICRNVCEIFKNDIANIKSRSNKELQLLIKDSGYVKSSFWKIVRKYIQSGFDDYSLVNQKGKSNSPRNISVKQGRPAKHEQGKVLNDQDYRNMDEAIKYYKSHRTCNIVQAYEFMLGKYYFEIITDGESSSYTIKPNNEIPTLAQFRYYLDKCLSKKDREIAKTSMMEYTNNYRPLLSDSIKAVNGPGEIWEVDECEWDISLVSIEDPTKVVGRPIVYMMKDVFTKQIVAYSASFDNNSYIGVTNCFMSLLVDKVELCAQLGINIKENDWPHKILPRALRTDNGAEYVSHEFLSLLNELGIREETVPPGMGSLKGDVENMFHEIQNKSRRLIEHDGLITKRHDSKHHQKALLNIKQFEQLLIIEIINHNKKYLKEYPLTSHMRVAHVKPTPSNLYAYGIKYGYSCKSISNENMFKYSLLSRIKCTLSREGITYEGLNYVDVENKALITRMENMFNDSVKIECRIDTRDIGKIYTLVEGNIISIPLNSLRTGNDEFIGMSLKEYESIRESLSEDKYLGEIYNRNNRIITNQIEENLIQSISRKGVETKNMRENRSKETELIKSTKTIMPETKQIENKEKFSVTRASENAWMERRKKEKEMDEK